MQQGPKGKKGKKKKKNVGVGDTGAARLNEECCAVRELVGRSELDFDENLMRNISILSKKRQKKSAPAAGQPPAAPAAGRCPDPVYTRAMPHDLSRSHMERVHDLSHVF